MSCDAGVVDEDVESAKFVSGQLKRVPPRRRIGDIACDTDRTAAELRNFGCELCKAIGSACEAARNLTPCLASSMASARPMPLDAPVMSTRRPVRSCFAICRSGFSLTTRGKGQPKA